VIIRQMLSDLQNRRHRRAAGRRHHPVRARRPRLALHRHRHPGAFLAGILGLYLAGLTINIVVLFSLILAVGMLVDDAIIVSEFAERRMSEGMPPREAYSLRRQAHGRAR
jgi:multidrug efflux pump